MNSKTDNFYNQYSFLYPLIDIFLKPQKRKLFEVINLQLPGRILEIGVGNGAHFHQYKLHKVIGIDTSNRMLEKAAKHLSKNIELFNMSGEDLQFPDNSFDYVVLSHVIAVVDKPEQVLNEAYRVLRPNGRLYILNHFTPRGWLEKLDKFLHLISRQFHFKAYFPLDHLNILNKFVPIKEIRFGYFSYFKLLIYSKP